jgi:hypothetical protein
MIPFACPCCEVSQPPHRDGCTYHKDCPISADDFDEVSAMRAEIARLREERDTLLESELWGVTCKPTKGPETKEFGRE